MYLTAGLRVSGVAATNIQHKHSLSSHLKHAVGLTYPIPDTERKVNTNSYGEGEEEEEEVTDIKFLYNYEGKFTNITTKSTRQESFRLSSMLYKIFLLNNLGDRMP